MIEDVEVVIDVEMLLAVRGWVDGGVVGELSNVNREPPPIFFPDKTEP